MSRSRTFSTARLEYLTVRKQMPAITREPTGCVPSSVWWTVAAALGDGAEPVGDGPSDRSLAERSLKSKTSSSGDPARDDDEPLDAIGSKTGEAVGDTEPVGDAEAVGEAL